MVRNHTSYRPVLPFHAGRLSCSMRSREGYRTSSARPIQWPSAPTTERARTGEHDAPPVLLDRLLRPPPRPRRLPPRGRDRLRGDRDHGDARPRDAGGPSPAEGVARLRRARERDPRTVLVDHAPRVGHRPDRQDLPRRPARRAGGGAARGDPPALTVAA